MSILPIYWVVIILSVLCVIAGIKMFFRVDDAVEERRRNMMKLYARLQELGLDDFATSAQAYVIGDYSGLYREFHQLLHTLIDPVKADAMLAKHFYLQLAHRITDPLELQKIQTVIGDVVAAAKTAASASNSAIASVAK